MKKKKLIILLFGIIFSLQTFAQESPETDIHWSKLQSMVRPQDFLRDYTFLKGDDKEFVFLYQTVSQGTFGGSGHVYFVKMNLETEESKYLRLELKDDGADRDWKTVKTINGEIHIFSTFQNKKDKKHYIFVETINSKTLEYNHDAKKIGEISYGGDIGGSKLVNFVVSDSPNKDLLLLSYAIEKGDEITNFDIQVFKKDWSELWSLETPFPKVEGKSISLSNYCLDNDGNVYVAQNRFDKKSGGWELYITSFLSTNKEPIVRQLSLQEDRHSISEKIFCNAIGEVICAGLYATPKRSSALGAYSLVYSSGLGKLVKQDEKAFDDAFITLGMTDKNIKDMLKNKEKGKDFDEGFFYRLTGDPLHRSDGNYMFMFEKYKLQIVTNRQGNITTRTFFYSHNDILALTCTPDGTIDWVQKVPKQQRTVNNGHIYSSFSATLDSKDNLNILYNEHLKDKMSDKVQPLMVTLDANGKMTFKELFKGDKDVRKTFAPILCRQLSGTKYLMGRQNIATLKGYRHQWAVVDIK